MGAKTSSQQHAPTPSPPEVATKYVVLCLASRNTTECVEVVAEEMGLQLKCVATNKEAVQVVEDPSVPLVAVVAALGTRPGVDTIFDSGGDRSTLLSAVSRRASSSSSGKFASLCPLPLSIVYSHTACRNSEFKQACFDAGADAVLCSAGELLEIAQEKLVVLPASLSLSRSESEQDSKSCSKPGEDGAGGACLYPHYASFDQYPVIGRRLVRDAELAQSLGSKDRRVKHSRYFTDDFVTAFKQLPAGRNLTLAPECGDKVRVVHVSDTHTHHNSVFIPDGDVLVHTGDLVGNYGGGYDLQSHLRSVVEWFTSLSTRFQHIVFIAGNHDTLLDQHNYPAEAAKAKGALLQALPANVRYLENSGVDLQVQIPGGGGGKAVVLRVWGSPITVSRLETMGKRYYSNGFETFEAQRKVVWQAIPEGLDLLLTHSPPHKILSSSGVGDKLLRSRLEAMAQPPKFHCFGHAHDFVGFESQSLNGTHHTMFINGAQEGLLRIDPHGSCAWVFDVAV